MNTASLISIPEHPKMVGQVTMISSKACTCKVAKRINAARDAAYLADEEYTGPDQCGHKIGGKHRPITFQASTKNLVMQTSQRGLDLVIQWIIGQMTTGQGSAAFQNGVNYGEFGTGTTPVTINDTALTIPTVRTIPSLQQDFGLQQAILQFFFPDATLPNNTYTEFGTFVNGTGILGSGNLFNHVVMASTYIKVSGQDTTVQVVFTITQ